MIMEKLYPIKGADGYYLTTSGILYLQQEDGTYTKIEPITSGEYPYWLIRFSGDMIPWSCHTLMALTFLGDGDGRVVNHKDGNKQNYHLDNLEWISQRDNVLHAQLHDLVPKTTPHATVVKICEAIDRGEPNYEIADELQVSPYVVSMIRRGQRHFQVSCHYNFMK